MVNSTRIFNRCVLQIYLFCQIYHQGVVNFFCVFLDFCQIWQTQHWTTPLGRGSAYSFWNAWLEQLHSSSKTDFWGKKNVGLTLWTIPPTIAHLGQIVDSHFMMYMEYSRYFRADTTRVPVCSVVPVDSWSIHVARLEPHHLYRWYSGTSSTVKCSSTTCFLGWICIYYLILRTVCRSCTTAHYGGLGSTCRRSTAVVL